MGKDQYGTLVERRDAAIKIQMDPVTAELLWEALYVLGEHVSAGVKVESMSTDMAERLGSLMGQLSEVVHSGGGSR